MPGWQREIWPLNIRLPCLSLVTMHDVAIGVRDQRFGIVRLAIEDRRNRRALRRDAGNWSEGARRPP